MEIILDMGELQEILQDYFDKIVYCRQYSPKIESVKYGSYGMNVSIKTKDKDATESE